MKKKVFGVLLLMETLFLFISALIALCYNEGDLLPFVYSALAAFAVGATLFFPNRHEKGNLNRKDCYIIISGVWIVFSIFGMIPLLLYGTVDNLTDAFFESMSGFTTTGASVLNNIDEQPHGILFWRSITQWLGGLGIMLFSIALLPSFNRNNKQLFSTESMAMSINKLRPKTQETARGILFTYLVLTIICATFYWVGPMSCFDAICHAMTTLGSGGFSTHQASIAFFNSAYIEYICALFMIFSGVNFSLYFLASTGKWDAFSKNEEFKWYMVATLILVVLIFSLFIVNPNHTTSMEMPKTLEEKFRTALFHVASIFSSSGFQSRFCDYDSWGYAFWIPTIFMMVCGACTGSSSGGFKMIRIMICMKNVRNELLLYIHPNAILSVKLSKHVVGFEVVIRTLAFLFIFTALILIGTMLLTFCGLSFDTALGSCISAISNTGPGFGATGPTLNYAEINVVAKWILSFLMLIGRLEIYTILLIFNPHFWNDK
ncbi:MAG: TrkH family potassium uptake protein [Paludibacteraceae bacterium]|nr:TrkH family potassium uptake protein [Paludibacteraceae bacterium]